MHDRVVHLELHTSASTDACSFYEQLCGWRPERIRTPWGSYVALHLGGGPVEGGVVECAVRRPVWLPYVEVEDITKRTDRAKLLGGTVLVEPREGPAGWRSVVATPAGGEIAFWQPKR
jgi:predicted enzyme related to lactoylglutathione lyase